MPACLHAGTVKMCERVCYEEKKAHDIQGELAVKPQGCKLSAATRGLGRALRHLASIDRFAVG